MHLRAFLIVNLFVLLVLGFGMGCGGKKIVVTDGMDPKDMKIPEALVKAFEVKEIAPATPAPEPVTELKVKSPKQKKTKPAKIKLTKAETASVEGMAGPGIAAAVPNRRPQVDPLHVGEKIWMDVTWLGTKAGEFLLEVLPLKMMNGRKVYDLKGTARTTDLFAFIYKAEDWVESFVDYDGWFPYKFVLHGDETKHIRNHLELFDHAAKKQYVHINDNRIQQNEIVEKKGFFDLTPYSQDSLSALYYARNFKLNDGDTIRFPMTTSGNQVETEVIVIAHEEVNTKMGYMKAIKTKVQTRFNGVLKQNGDAFMWFSDDERKYLLRFEAKVRIGWVAGITKKIEPGDTEAPQPTPPGKSDPKLRSWFKKLLNSAEVKMFEEQLNQGPKKQ